MARFSESLWVGAFIASIFGKLSQSHPVLAHDWPAILPPIPIVCQLPGQVTSTLRASVSSSEVSTEESYLRAVLWSLNAIIYIQMRLIPGTQYMPNKHWLLSLFPKFISVNPDRLTDSKWHSSWLPPWKRFSSANYVCAFINVQVTHRSLYKHWPFQSRLLFQSHQLWQEPQQGSFCQQWVPGWEKSGPPSAGADWRKGHHMSFPEGWLTPRFGASSPEIFLKALPASPVGSVSTRYAVLWWKM